MNIKYQDKLYIERKLKEAAYWHSIIKAIDYCTVEELYKWVDTRAFARMNLERVCRSICKREGVDTDCWKVRVYSYIKVATHSYHDVASYELYNDYNKGRYIYA